MYVSNSSAKQRTRSEKVGSAAICAKRRSETCASNARGFCSHCCHSPGSRSRKTSPPSGAQLHQKFQARLSSGWSVLGRSRVRIIVSGSFCVSVVIRGIHKRDFQFGTTEHKESGARRRKRMSDLAEYYQLVNLERCQKPDRRQGNLRIRLASSSEQWLIPLAIDYIINRALKLFRPKIGCTSVTRPRLHLPAQEILFAQLSCRSRFEAIIKQLPVSRDIRSTVNVVPPTIDGTTIIAMQP